MSKFQLIHFNRLDCELGRYDVIDDDCGAPLMLATVAQNTDVREALDVLEPGDRLELVQLEELEELEELEPAPVELAAPAADPLAPGAIFYSSWGYEQTNVDFHRVVRAAQGWIVLEKIEKVETSDDTEDRPATLTGRVVPADPIEPIGPMIRRMIRADGAKLFVKLNSYAYAYPWDGAPKRVSHYG